jgi:hypothetical protein
LCNGPLLEACSHSNGALAFGLDVVIEDTSVVTLLSAVVVAASWCRRLYPQVIRIGSESDATST